MAVKTFGTLENGNVDTDHLAALVKIAGEGCPIAIQTSSSNELTGATYETEWKEGTTTPITNKKGVVTGYKENYKVKKLTQEQIKKLDKYIDDNLVS